MSEIKYSDLEYEQTLFCTRPWKKSKSDAEVVKTELLPHDSTSIIGTGTFNPECKGEFPGERKPWTDLSIQDAREHVMGGGSIFISGLPGVAKSYTCVEWVNVLKETRRVILTAPTHVATRNMRCEGVESTTVQRLYNRYLKYGTFDAATTLVIDEISQVNTTIWHALMPLAKFGVQITCMGNVWETQRISF